jgi:hypothetical protein
MPAALKPRWLRSLVVMAIVGWTCALGAGLQQIWKYGNTAGTASSAPSRWPSSSSIARQAGQTTLIMFVHPRCTCTRASLLELQEIASRSSDAVSVWILLLEPEGAGSDWESTSVVELARLIRNTRLTTDYAGTEAARFGASTSGHVVVYAADGSLQFSGGITGARGHVGANEGQRSVNALLAGAPAPLHEHPTFGCGFHDPQPAAP